MWNDGGDAGRNGGSSGEKGYTSFGEENRRIRNWGLWVVEMREEGGVSMGGGGNGWGLPNHSILWYSKGTGYEKAMLSHCLHLELVALEEGREE